MKEAILNSASAYQSKFNKNLNQLHEIAKDLTTKPFDLTKK